MLPVLSVTWKTTKWTGYYTYTEWRQSKHWILMYSCFLYWQFQSLGLCSVNGWKIDEWLMNWNGYEREGRGLLRENSPEFTRRDLGKSRETRVGTSGLRSNIRTRALTNMKQKKCYQLNNDVRCKHWDMKQLDKEILAFGRKHEDRNCTRRV
jgi:hypothetical protein